MPGSRATAPPPRPAAAEALGAGGAALRRTALRFSLCADDAEDACQRAIEILLTKAPAGLAGAGLAAWMQVVVRREALALRRARERLLGRAAAGEAPGEETDPLSGVACERPGPLERAERREAAARALRLLAQLKPDERRALILKAQGYSYAEIGRLCGWTYTKVNRCLAEGRARLRELARER